MRELSRRRRLLVLGICCLSLFIVGLDSTIVNLALPAIRSDLDASVSKLQWTIDAYTLVIASLLMLSGSTADRIGRRRTFQAGLVLFGVGSLLCGIAPTVDLLIVFRMLQAIGGSMLNPVAMSIITNTFTDPRERAQAIGVWGGVVGLSLAVGPVVGGALVDTAGWRYIFWINVPVVLIAFLLTALFVPESRAAVARRIDPVGQLLVMLFLVGLTYGIIEGRSAGWGSPLIVGCFVVVALSLVFLALYERRREQPLLEPRFFRSAPFSGATLIAVCGFAALSGFLFLNSLYLQEVRGFSALHAGLLTLPMAAMTVVFAPLSGWLVGNRGPRVPLVVAGTMLAVSGLVLSRLTDSTATPLLLGGYLIFGLGFGMLSTPITNAAVSGMPRSQAGVAAAIASTSRQVGASLGVAIVGTVLTARLVGSLETGFVSAARLGWFIIAGCGVLVLALGVITTGRWARSTAEAVAADLQVDRATVSA
ncbi:EmrB/QacA subfamily drug resistance transporter [Kribbella orskensis]|uniref:EmrB/QacA subfamily drug resistance transporter n=1 Tax=Kribbella orskensis TaxID=2512216 RepID=A0ABY2BPU7_9ACTN|nr:MULTISPECIES: MFS transporter [Kribbella]TCN39747.1 EmrB/QacA subfamily drug resistance transporter [Kribbella sp. VKM Ac-2500]TCO27470.1 EmrB/QacA subfamily drug resistance transporter [Kribbella orskensis]